MDNPIQSGDAIEGDSFSYRDPRGEKLQLESTPFSPVFEVPEKENEEDPELPQKIKFNQAYIVNYLRTPIDYVYIEKMDEWYDLERDATGATTFIREYEVELELSELDGSIKGAKFQRKPKEGEQGYRDPEKEFNVYNENSSFPVKECLRVYLPVCELVDGELTEIYLRDNIHWWGDLVGSRCNQWAPRIVDERATPDDPPAWKVYINQGIVNGTISEPDTFGTSLSEQEMSELRYVLYHVDIIDERVSLVWGEIVNYAGLEGKELDPVAINSAPIHVDFIAASFVNGKVCTYYNKPITISSYVWLKQTKQGEIAPSERPYDEYIKLRID